MGGFLKLHALGVIETLPRVFGVQSHHADPVYRYYAADAATREYKPVTVTASVAQAAMIGNPVSFPRVRHFAQAYEKIGGAGSFQVLQVTEQQIMDSMIEANRHGHIACTQGGECLAGARRAKELGLVGDAETLVLDATAHHLKFIGFQEMYFENTFPPQFGVVPRPELANRPELIITQDEKKALAEKDYVVKAAENVVSRLGLAKK